MNKQHSNRLAQASSPYLLQHAHNPVDWYEWGEEALQKARTEDKPIIVSIGYAACHWCHVMERECFENEAIAHIMNQYFICIKVDREERPDVDAIYMEAVQAMGLNGGWPLNAFLTPEGKPFYAGTYFPPKKWTGLLQNIAQIYAQDRQRLEQSAEQFRQVIARSEVEKYKLIDTETEFSKAELGEMFRQLSTNFDKVFGGMDKAPKFPMPAIYTFLLRFYHLTQQPEALAHTELTLNAMAKGGIYDTLAGGFARYSVDSFWLVPHFEKMLYDNAQLMALYAEAYTLTKKPLYAQVIRQTAQWLKTEMRTEEGAFYSALDADSEGIEGKFYVWTKAELEQVLADDAPIAMAYYNCTDEGNWEHGYNILHTPLQRTDEAFAQAQQWTMETLQTKKQQWQMALCEARSQRIRPQTDDKILTSWNALMLKGLVVAYQSLQDTELLALAQQNAHFITQKLILPNGSLWRTYKNGKATIKAYLEDYATVIDALLHLFQADSNKQWLQTAEQLTNYVLAHFEDKKEGLYFFTDSQAEQLIARKKEIFDNVIPSSNAIMAHNLYLLGQLLAHEPYQQKALQMLGKVKKLMRIQVEYLSHWASLMTKIVQPQPEIVIIGKDYQVFWKEIQKYYLPNKIIIATETEVTGLPLLENRRAIEGKTTIYVCFNRTCLMPVHSIAEALKQLKQA